MTPIVAKANGPGWVIYMRPSMAEAKAHLDATHGRQWDPIERNQVAGGVPDAMQRLPGVYATEAEARASMRRAA